MTKVILGFFIAILTFNVAKAQDNFAEQISKGLTNSNVIYASNSTTIHKGNLTTINGCANLKVSVASNVANSFQGFLCELHGVGYPLRFVGGWRAHGSCRGCNKHPAGLAIDVNQTARNRVTVRLPTNVTAMAAKYGLTHGAVWCHKDQGHFEAGPSVGACSERRLAQHTRHHRRYAQR